MDDIINEKDDDDDDRIITKHSKFISNSSRPLDAIGFLSNDQLFIDDYDIDLFDQIKLMKPNKMHQHSMDVELTEIDKLITSELNKGESDNKMKVNDKRNKHNKGRLAQEMELAKDIKKDRKDSIGLSRNELMKLSKPKLVKMCKKYKVSSNGTKMDMVKRILNKQ
eukprot:104171_1